MKTMGVGVFEGGRAAGPGPPITPPPAILACDDDPHALAILAAFARKNDFVVETSSEPEEVLARTIKSRPDVVILDVMMPRISGLDLCRALKSHPKTHLIPVVIATALGGHSHRLEGINAGCDDFVSKPFDWAELGARVRSLTRLHRATQALESAESVLAALGKVIEARDPTTAGHCERLAGAARAFGDWLGLPENALLTLVRAASLHDIGKIGIPDAILLGDRPLSAQERAAIQRHSTLGAELLAPLESLQAVIPIVRHHHEHWNGSGYPDGLRGEKIPYLARVFQILDAYDALTSLRTYKKSLTALDALGIIQKEAAAGLWDPSVVEQFTAWLRQNNFQWETS